MAGGRASRRAREHIEEPFEGELRFRTLAEAEATLLRLESRRKLCSGGANPKELEACRRAGLLIRRRAEMISRNRRVGAWKRALKAEVAVWFRIWLETPEIVLDWLALRKATSDFQRLLREEAKVDNQDSPPGSS